jgi:putative oxidoreductase
MILRTYVDRYLKPFIPLWDVLARLCMARIFFKSGLTKIDDWQGTLWLFKQEYNMNFMPEFMAYSATALELVAPVLLLVGFLTRFAALSLALLSVGIHLTYPTFHEHYFWMLILTAITLHGPSTLSLDYWIWGRKKR